MRSMSLKTFLPMFIALVLLVFPLVPVFAAETTANITVNVTVAPVAEITVYPNYLLWENLYPGSTGTSQLVEVKNSGSVNVTNLYIYASTLYDETSRPYGTGDPSRYSAAGVIVVRNETDTVPQFVGRIEWNWTDSINNADFSAINSLRAWGFYKNTSFEYVWAVGNGTGGFCNNTGAQFAIEDDPDTGTVTTRTPTTTGITRDGGDANFGYFSVSGRAAFGGDYVCVAVAADCSNIYVYKYDRRSGFSTCQNAAYLTTRTLTPGDIYTIPYLNAFIPNGIPAGILKLGTLTVVASY